MDDHDLTRWEAEGLTLPAANAEGFVEADGARIWFASIGEGPAVVLLHGGMGNATNWGKQVPAIVAAGYRAIVIDSRGQGRSSHDNSPLTYRQMADDTLKVLDHLGVERAAFIGWSDGAVVGLLLSDTHPARSAGLFFFACNVDPSGTKPFVYTDMIGRCLNRHKQDWADRSPVPDAFDATFELVNQMQSSQPNLSAADLARLRVPVWSVLGDSDEFIEPAHADYLAATIPGAKRVTLAGVGHFAPVQNPGGFNAAALDFLKTVAPH